MFRAVLGGFGVVMLSLDKMAMRDMRVVMGLLVMAFLMCARSFLVVVGGLFVMFGRLVVMLGERLLGHGLSSLSHALTNPAGSLPALCNNRATPTTGCISSREKVPRRLRPEVSAALSAPLAKPVWRTLLRPAPIAHCGPRQGPFG